MSKRGIEEVVETLFGVPIAVGTIANLEQEMSAALASAYQEVRRHVADAEVRHLDETGWHRFRGGGCSRSELGDRVRPHVEALGRLLLDGHADPDARLLDRYPLLWLFTSVAGVEPTNNHAERVQRRAVLWRQRSFGCASASGCRFVERIGRPSPTVCATG